MTISSNAKFYDNIFMDYKWLNTQFRLHPDKVKAELAEFIGLEPPAISKILAGTRQIKASEYHAMRRFFGLPVDGERMTGAKKNKDAGYVIQPLQDRSKHQETGSWVMPASLLSQGTRAAPENIRVYPISDNTMAPDFQSGEYVLVDVSDVRPAPAGVFILSDHYGHILRYCEILPQSRPPKIRIQASGKTYEPYVTSLKGARIVGRVIAKLEWL